MAKDETVTGPVFALMAQAWDSLRPHLVQTKFGAGGIFEERILYPEDACREALTNAIAHRDYSIEGRGVEVFVFDDRMEVKSPGALLSNVPLAELRQLKGLHQSRNAFLARVLRELGYMREMGEGFRRIWQLMKAQDLIEPDLRSDLESFTITLHHRSVFSEAAQRWIGAFEKFNLSREEKKVVLLGAEDAVFSPRQVWDAVGIIDTEDYRALLERLRVKGLLISTMPSRVASNRASQRDVPRKDVARFRIRRPQECEVQFADLIRACGDLDVEKPASAAVLTGIQNKRGEQSPYRARGGGVPRALRELDLVDDDRRPTARLRAFLDALPDRRPRVSIRTTVGSGAPVVTEAERKELAEVASKALYVGNLDYEVTQQEIRELFARCGEIRAVRIPLDVFTGKSRGFAFVQMDLLDSAKTALSNLDGYLVRGRRLRLGWER